MKATFAAGCFWGIEKTFAKIRGVTQTEVGYTGGHISNPTYEQVCSNTTGHAEAVQLEYDPSIISYEALLDVFWNCHNPTSLNRQGPDIGRQYRSAIFYHTEEQRQSAIESKKAVENSGQFKNKIVTEIVEASTFYPAEDYHQKYWTKH